MKKLLILIIVVVVVVGGVLLFGRRGEAPTPAEQPAEGGKPAIVFTKPKKSAHYESNTPPHGAILAGVPLNVVIDVNFDLAPPSAITIEKDGQDYGVGATVIDQNRLAMRRAMDPAAPDGIYTVKYTGCWPDGSCHQGHFQFAINRSQAESYLDMRGQKEVAISMANIAFNPRNVRVSRGKKITWTNNDLVEHFVNTDSHPAHTYYLAQNSRALATGQSHSVTFDKPGIYLYHCSAHADEDMYGTILVE